MKLLSNQEFNSLVKLTIHLFPFCFQLDYLVVNSSVKMLCHDNFFVPIKITKNKFFKTAQFQFTPLTLKGERLEIEVEKKFCEDAIAFISKNKLAHRIIQPQNYALFFSYPRNSEPCNFGTYLILLKNKSDKDLIDNMQARYRAAIRQVENLNVEIKFGLDELTLFQELHSDTMSRTNAYSEKHDTLKKELLSLPHNTLLATIYIDNKLQGGVYLAYSNFAAYYMHGASSSNTVAAGAIKYLHYKIMCLMRDKGVAYYDFVGARLSDVKGTKLEGIQNFKKRFGAQLVKGYLWKLDINKPTCLAYDNLLKLKCALNKTIFPVDIIDQEKNKEVIL